MRILTDFSIKINMLNASGCAHGGLAVRGWEYHDGRGVQNGFGAASWLILSMPVADGSYGGGGKNHIVEKQPHAK